MRYLESPRVLWRAAGWTTAAAVLAVVAVRELAVWILHPDPAFTPLSLGSPIVATIVCTGAAIYVFVGMMSDPHPVGVWRRISGVVLVLSLVPCVFIGATHSMGGRWPEACALMAMHGVVWAICAALLPSLATTKQPPVAQSHDRPLSIV